LSESDSTTSFDVSFPAWDEIEIITVSLTHSLNGWGSMRTRTIVSVVFEDMAPIVLCTLIPGKVR
jgi:hypothetical protein